MRSQLPAYTVIIALGIVSGALVFLSVFMYVKYYDVLYDTDSLVAETLLPIRIIAVDTKNQWFEGQEIGHEYRGYERIRIHVDTKTYVLERVPRVENGILIGYRSHDRVTLEDIPVGSIVNIAIKTRPDYSSYAPIILVDALESS